MLSRFLKPIFAFVATLDKSRAGAVSRINIYRIMKLSGMRHDNAALSAYVGELERVARSMGVPFWMVEKVVVKDVMDLEPRIQAVLPRIGASVSPMNAVYVRSYIHSAGNDERDLRMAYIEEKSQEYATTLERMIARLPHVKTAQSQLRALKPFVGDKPLREFEDYHRGFMERTLARIWEFGPNFAAAEFNAYRDFYELNEGSYEERLRARARIRRREENAQATQKIVSTARKRRVIDAAQEKPALENAPQVKVSKIAEPDIDALLEQARVEYTSLASEIETRVKDLETLSAEIKKLTSELDFYQELEADYAKRLKNTALARRELVQRITAIDANAIVDDRAGELDDLIEAALPKIVTGAHTDETQAAMPQLEENRDIAHFLMNDDPHIRVKAERIVQLRQDTLPLEAEWLRLGNEMDRASFRGRYMQKQIDRLNKRVSSSETLLIDMTIEHAQMEYLLQDLASNTTDTTSAQDGKYPSSLKVLAAWADANLQGRVIITKKALRHAMQSPYEKPEHVYAALDLLANEYWTQKNAGRDMQAASLARAAFTRAAAQQHLSLGGSITAVHPSFAEQYKATLGGQSYFLNMHLARGVVRDQRRSMQIYYTWDDTRKAVIVGHLPSHLSNRND